MVSHIKTVFLNKKKEKPGTDGLSVEFVLSVDDFLVSVRRRNSTKPSNYSPYFLKLPKQNGTNHLIF